MTLSARFCTLASADVPMLSTHFGEDEDDDDDDANDVEDVL